VLALSLFNGRLIAGEGNMPDGLTAKLTHFDPGWSAHKLLEALVVYPVPAYNPLDFGGSQNPKATG
jgi:hypothetical protein